MCCGSVHINFGMCEKHTNDFASAEFTSQCKESALIRHNEAIGIKVWIFKRILECILFVIQNGSIESKVIHDSEKEKEEGSEFWIA